MRFTLEDGKRKYKVLVISPLRKSFPIYFTSGNEAYHEVKIGMKHAHFSLLRFYFPYENEGDGTGILLIAPDPESVYVSEGDKSRRIFNADKLYDNVAYDSDAFFGALSRGCLGKYDGMKKQ